MLSKASVVMVLGPVFICLSQTAQKLYVTRPECKVWAMWRLMPFRHEGKKRYNFRWVVIPEPGI